MAYHPPYLTVTDSAGQEHKFPVGVERYANGIPTGRYFVVIEPPIDPNVYADLMLAAYDRLANGRFDKAYNPLRIYWRESSKK